MKNSLFLMAIAAILFAACSQQGGQSENIQKETTMTAIPKDSVIRLTDVDMTMQTTLMQALKDRASIPHGGKFSPELISLEQLSSLLWAANGFNRDSLHTPPLHREPREVFEQTREVSLRVDGNKSCHREHIVGWIAR